MASISLRNASVDIPVFAVGNNSLKVTLLRKAIGGRFARAGSNLIVRAVSDVSLEARDGDRIGVIGSNGSGKTTLLRLIAGVYPPTTGSVTVSGRISPMFSTSLGMTPDATGLENIRISGTLWGLTRTEIEQGIDDVVEFTELGEFLNIPVRTYSSGMLTRLSFAIATLRKPEILLLDEIIGAGDAAFMAKARARMQGLVSRSNILFVSSHSDAVIRGFCNKVAWMDRGTLVGIGEVEEMLPAYRKAVAAAASASAAGKPPDAIAAPAADPTPEAGAGAAADKAVQPPSAAPATEARPA